MASELELRSRVLGWSTPGWVGSAVAENATLHAKLRKLRADLGYSGPAGGASGGGAPGASGGGAALGAGDAAGGGPVAAQGGGGRQLVEGVHA